MSCKSYGYYSQPKTDVRRNDDDDDEDNLYHNVAMACTFVSPRWRHASVDATNAASIPLRQDYAT